MRINGVNASDKQSESDNNAKFGDSFDLDIPDSNIKDAEEKQSKQDKQDKRKAEEKVVGNHSIMKSKPAIKKPIQLIAAVLCVTFIIVTFVSLIMTGSNWFTYRSMMKDIQSNYDSELIENKVYTKIELKTANVVSYSNGMCDTDLGKIKCDKPAGTVMIVFTDINGDLRPISDIDKLSNSSVEYVCGDFRVPDNSIVITSEKIKALYKYYLDDMAIANETHDKIGTYKGYLLFGLIMALISGVTFAVTSSNLGFKNDETSNSDKNTGNVDNTSEKDGNDENV